ncbi:MAG: plasmid pRiA4b ORF-3 family protein, partial [Clostridiales bacterium]|nr:plasmid pRiA4b ORF-3 family protein [Clostridiales bacterium]
MKAYKIKIELTGSKPLIWRRVLVPEEITFERLHDVIQFAMGWGNDHLYDFNLKEEKLRITSDEEVIKEFEYYSKLKLTEKNDPNGYIRKRLEIKPKLSSKVKIDKYLIKEKNIEYVYDFGDYWKHNITLEEIIEDYEYAYPMCIEGEGACPPEDVGGIYG